MSKFKVGDRVKVVKDFQFFTLSDCLELANTVTKVKLAKPKSVKYAVVSETFSDVKELRKYLKANKGKVLDVYKVRNKVDYKISEYLMLKGE